MSTILVADDRPLNRQYLVSLLSYFGHHMVEASDGEEALRLARADHPALLITDLVMPGMDGHELAIRMRADPTLKQVPVIFYSATYSLRQAERLAEEVGAFGVLPKPSGPEEVLKTVNLALGLPAWNAESTDPAPEIFPSPPGMPLIETLPKGLADLEALAARLAAILEMSLELASQSDPERLLQLLAHAIRKMIGSKHVALGLRNESSSAVWAFFSSGAGEADGSGALVSRIGPPRESPFSPPGSVLGKLVEERRPQRMRNVEATALGIEVAIPQTGAILASVLAVPLMFSGALIGWILLLDKLGADEFSETDQHVACTVGTEGAIAFQQLQGRKKSEEALRKSKSMFESLFESAPDALLATGREGRITQVNSQAERMFGYGRNELVGRAVEVLVPERFRPKHPGYREAYHSEPQLRPMGAGLELFGRRKDGTEFPIDIMLNSMQAEPGGLVVSVVRDITARKQAEEQILQLNAELADRVNELQAVNHSLESFSSSISHDLRAPLRAIAGFASMLQADHSRQLDPEGQRLLSVITDKAAKMGQLIEDLLQFSRVTRAEMATSPIDMNQIALSVVQELRVSEPARNVEFNIEPLPFANGDLPMLRQALTNLVANAWKFTREAPRAVIEIGSTREGDQTVYYVKDNGAGFDMQYAHRLFGVFQRLHSDEKFEGTGIGLALVNQIVERHGGRIWAEGKVGGGAIFRFTLLRRSKESQ